MIFAATVDIGKALLNTLIGMGTVFIVLIFISFVISLFGVLNKYMEKRAGKNSAPAPAAQPTVETAAEHAANQIIQTEELSNDLELVAVITAAIASYQGTTVEGFRVRSIKRAGNR